MEIIFPAIIELPSVMANRQYIMWMCQALSQHAEVVLYVTKIYKPLTEIYEFYDVLPSFQIREIDHVWKPRSFWAARSFARCIATEDPSIVYVADVRLLQFLKYFAPARNYVYDTENLPSELGQYVRHINSTKAVICYNQFFKEALVEIGIDPNKIIIAPSGVNLEKYQSQIPKETLRRELKLPLTKKIVMYTGHFYEWKGVEILLRAASQLDSETEVCLVGGKDADIKRIFESGKGLSWTNIKMIPFQPPALVAKFQQAADVLVVPNISASADSSYYTSPLKLFQYMAAGRPIVASDLPSLRTVLNSQNAYLVRPDDPLALAQGIREALADNQEAARRTERAQEEVKQYTWEKRADRILNFILERDSMSEQRTLSIGNNQDSAFYRFFPGLGRRL
jgi:glycosyltransferase involved in cell wall biosynthesis